MKKIRKVESNKNWKRFFMTCFCVVGILSYTMTLYSTKNFLKLDMGLLAGLVALTQLAFSYARAVDGKEKTEVLNSASTLGLTLLIVGGNMVLNLSVIVSRLNGDLWPNLFTEVLLSSLSGALCFLACRLFLTGMEKLTINLWKRCEKFPLTY